MLNPRRTLFFTLLLMMLMTALGGTAAAQGAEPRTATNGATGVLEFIGADTSSPLVVSAASQPGLSVEQRAAAVLDAFAPQFGVRAGDLALTRQTVLGANRVSFRYQQQYNGIPVFGGIVVMNITSNGGLISMMGKTAPNLTASTTPLISQTQAEQSALQAVQAREGVAGAFAASALNVYDARITGGAAASSNLIWNVTVVKQGAPIDVTVLVDAVTGAVVTYYNRVDSQWTGVLGGTTNATALPLDAAGSGRATPDLATYDSNNQVAGNEFVLPGTLLCDESDVSCTGGADFDADEAHKHARGVFNMYDTVHGRDSLDDAGLQVISSVHVGVQYCNAFWNSEQMAYGDGCGSSIVRDDVVAHELTHGVTEFSSGLEYVTQSGAINESFSDVWGEYYDLTDANGDETAENRWRIGEELDFGGATNGLRDMQDPTIFGDPDRKGSPLFYLGSGDNGGVHYNSGVGNKAFYLAVDGDTFNGQTITGIGLAKAIQVWYDVQVSKLTAFSDYEDLGNALNQSCSELIGTSGITAGDCQQIAKVVTATQLLIAQAGAPIVRAEVCPAGGTPNFLFTDDFENGGGKWNTGKFDTAGPQAWTIASSNSPLYGSASMYGEDLDEESFSFAGMKNALTIPANAYLYFEHTIDFEDPYDGGVIVVNTEGTSWDYVPGTVIDSGVTYNREILNNYIAYTPGFAYPPGYGIGSTRVNLAGLQGVPARFGFAVASDIFGGAEGWHIDNVSIYTCGEGGGGSLVNGGFEVVNGEGKPVIDPWESDTAGDKAKCNKEGKTYSHTGNCAFRFKGTPGESGKLKQTVTPGAMTAGTDVSIFAYVNAEKGSASGKIKFTIGYSDGTEKQKIDVSFGQTTGYQLYGNTLTLTSGAVDKIKVQISDKSSSGKVYVDDVALETSTTTRSGWENAVPVTSLGAGAGASASPELLPLP
jgi:bacillolysin